MAELITNIAYGVLKSVLCLIAGSIISYPLYRICVHNKAKASGNIINLFLIIISSLSGLVLPLDIYGIFPVAAAIMAAGLPLAASVPLLLSSTLFNLLIPYTDPTFSWTTGGLRVIFAFLAAVLGGVLSLKIKNPVSFIKDSNFIPYKQEASKVSSILKIIQGNFNGAGLYIIIGVCLNEIFHQYILYQVLQFIYTNPNTVSVPKFFAGMNVLNPFFVQTMNIINMLINLVTLSGLFLIFKIKGVLLYISYFIVLALLMGITVFF